MSDGSADGVYPVNDRTQPDELEALRRQNLLIAEENARLKEMLGLEEPKTPAAAPAVGGPTSAITATSSPVSKVELFTSLFRGRVEAHAKRWQSRSGGSGYAPACATSGVRDSATRGV